MKKDTQNTDDWKNYREVRNLCTSSLQADKKSYYNDQFKRFEKENDSGKLYKKTKHLLGWKTGGAPTSFLVNGQRVCSPQKMADLQIDVFTEKIRKLVRMLPPITDDPHKILKMALQKWGPRADTRGKFSLREISLAETANLLSKLGNSKSFGHDGLDAVSLKMAAGSLVKPINFLIN